ncbi:MAG: hypothetical protein KGN00_04800 [Chloroflexota bacterium]|nr:hypothetical protein [Chloroflexota bacterium]MDE3192988.1 hypothetical protein [Chloroflexota bacterium]
MARPATRGGGGDTGMPSDVQVGVNVGSIVALIGALLFVLASMPIGR